MTPNDQLPDPADEKMSGIISELRQFLSEVKEEKKAEPLPNVSPLSSNPNNSVVSESPSFRREPESSAPPLSFFGGSSGASLESPTTSIGEPDPGSPPSGLPSDSEFWNGNVLGWPSITDEQSSKEEGSVTPFFSEATPVLEKDELSPSPFSDQSSFMPPPVAPPPVIESSEEKKEEPSLISDISPFAAFGASLGAIQQPVSPTEQDVTKTEAPAASQFSSVEGSDSMQVGANVLPADYGANFLEGADGSSLDSDQINQIKPDHIIHVACIVPSGQEKKGQQFFSKLKEFGLRSKNKLEIEAVFIHDWSSELIDVMAWEKSALLSGADVMFIVASRSDLEKFTPHLKTNAAEAMPKRLISLEQIPLQNLYADLLWMLSGKAYVKG